MTCEQRQRIRGANRMTMDDSSASNALDALMTAFFQAVSFAEGEQPHYARIYDLFIQEGVLIKASGATPEIATVAQFIAPRQRMVDAQELTQFQETERAYTQDLFGNVAQRFSVYDKHGTMQGVRTVGKGKIATQFVRTPKGWQISAMAWDDERPGLTIPE